MFRNLKGLTLLATLVCYSPLSIAQDVGPQSKVRDGLNVRKPAALQGYALVAPMNSRSTYLIDNDGRIVNEWKSEYTPAFSAYLLPSGHLLRPGAETGPMQGGPGAGGRIQEFDWEGNLVWDFSFTEISKDSKLRPHHDICPLPNGNVLVVCSDPKTKEESLEAGRLPPLASGPMQADAIVEIKPVGRDGGEIVWQWFAWDHLIQDVHKEKPGFGDVSEHPELIDINFSNGMMDRMMQDPEQLAKLRSLGYVGGGTAAAPPADRQPTLAPVPNSSDDRRPDDRGGPSGRGPAGRGGPGQGGPGQGAPGRGGPGQGGPGRGGPGGGRGGPPGMQGDWMHVNSVNYNAKLDQIMISVHEFSEVWIIDHSTTTQEAASHSGGKSGKGGDLLYRWGNPRAYRSGTNVDQRLFAQHCAHWIADGLPGAGNMLVFNNGANRPDGTYSSADEVELPVNADGTYTKEEYVAFGPEAAKWRYGSPDNKDFFSMLISGCLRLPNGNTFICSGNNGILFEVTPEGEVVWQYKHPGSGFGGPGGPGGFGPEMFSGIVPAFLAGMLGVDEDQRAKIKSLQDEVDAKLKSLLQEDQLAKLKTSGNFPAPGAGPKVGDIVSESKRAELSLSEEQTSQLDAFQIIVTSKLNEILTEQQRKQISDPENMFAGGPPGFGGPGFGPPGGGAGFGPPGFGPPGFGPDAGGPGGRGGGPGGPGGRGGRGGRGGGPGGPGGGPGGIFRSYKYAADYAGLKGKVLTPGKKLEEVAAVAPPGEPGSNGPQGPGRRPPRDGEPRPLD